MICYYFQISEIIIVQYCSPLIRLLVKQGKTFLPRKFCCRGWNNQFFGALIIARAQSNDCDFSFLPAIFLPLLQYLFQQYFALVGYLKMNST